jgi:peptidyl-prolyl cis-trans isomerase SurA
MKMQQRMTLSRFLTVSLFFLTIVAYGQDPGQDGVVVDKIIAKIDDYIVLKSDLERAYLDYLASGKPRSEEAKCQMLESLVVNKMLVAKAEIDSILVLDLEVNSNVDRRIQQIIQGFGGSIQELEVQYGKNMDQIKEEIFENIKEQMIISKMQNELTASIDVSPIEVKRFFKKIPSDSLPYFSTEVKVAQIVVVPKANQGQKEKVRQQMMDMREQILRDQSAFSSLARRYSEDGSAASGGDLPFYKRGEVDPAFEASAMTLEEGELSMPIESQFGYHLIQLISRRGNTFKTRHILMIPKPDESDFIKSEKFLDSLRSKIMADSLKFQAAAKDHSDDQFTSSNGGFFVDDQTGSLSVSVESLPPDLFFAIDTMNIGRISRPMRFQQEDGSFAFRIVYFKDKIPPHLANLDDDYQKIAAATLNNKKNQKLNEWFTNAREGIFIEVDPEYNHCSLMEQ